MRHLVLGPSELCRIQGRHIHHREADGAVFVDQFAADRFGETLMACLLAQYALCSGIERNAKADPT